MATPMPVGQEEAVSKGPRVVVRISPELQFLLSTMAQHLLCTKKSLHDAIWAAGLKAHLGVNEEVLDDCAISSLPRGTQPPRDPKKLAQLLLSER